MEASTDISIDRAKSIKSHRLTMTYDIIIISSFFNDGPSIENHLNNQNL